MMGWKATFLVYKVEKNMFSLPAPLITLLSFYLEKYSS